MSDFSQPHGLQPTRLLHPWDFPGKSTGVGCHCLLLYNGYKTLNTTILMLLQRMMTMKKLSFSELKSHPLDCTPLEGRSSLSLCPSAQRTVLALVPRGTQWTAVEWILWPPDVKSWHIGKDPDAGRDWRQEAKGVTEDEMVGWHHQLNRHELEKILGGSEGQGSWVCCSPWRCKGSDTA